MKRKMKKKMLSKNYKGTTSLKYLRLENDK